MEESLTGRRHRGPREERENPFGVGSQDLDPASYIQILREIDSSLGNSRPIYNNGADVNERGDVLVFVSGLHEIKIIINALAGVPPFCFPSPLVRILFGPLGVAPPPLHAAGVRATTHLQPHAARRRTEWCRA